MALSILRCIVSARCPSNFSSIAIELNVSRDGFSSITITIELTSVTFGHGFKNPVQSFWYLCAWDKDFLSQIISLDICITGWCYG